MTMVTKCKSCRTELPEWKADPAMALCERCFFDALLAEYPQLRIEGDKVIGIGLRATD